jgi:hypothetical protein
MPRPGVTLGQPLHIRGPTSLGRGVAVGAAGMGDYAGHPSPDQPRGCGCPQMKRSCTPWEGELGADRSDSGLDDRGPRDIHGLLDGDAPGPHGCLPTVEERGIPPGVQTSSRPLLDTLVRHEHLGGLGNAGKSPGGDVLRDHAEFVSTIWPGGSSGPTATISACIATSGGFNVNRRDLT